jgi:hypothetical protein
MFRPEQPVMLIPISDYSSLGMCHRVLFALGLCLLPACLGPDQPTGTSEGSTGLSGINVTDAGTSTGYDASGSSMPTSGADTDDSITDSGVKPDMFICGKATITVPIVTPSVMLVLSTW